MNRVEKRLLLEWAADEKDFLFSIRAKVDLHEKILNERIKKILLKKRGKQ
jgi:hypothetical protein